MSKVFTLIVVTLLTFNVIAINNKVDVNEHNLCATEKAALVEFESIEQNNFAILEKADLNESSLFKVSVSCSQCSVDLQICLTMYPRPQCRQDFADCREICN